MARQLRQIERNLWKEFAKDKMVKERSSMQKGDGNGPNRKEFRTHFPMRRVLSFNTFREHLFD